MNPFPTSTYLSSAYFCDREEETKQLVENLRNQINTTLFSYRRLGKTALLHHVFEKLKTDKAAICIYLDIFGTEDFQSFLNELATAIYTVISPKKSLGKKLLEGIQRLRPTISFDELSGTPSISFNFSQFEQQKKTLEQLFQFIDNQNVKIYLAIDEFQQILEYPEKNTDAILRSQLQRLKNTHFIFSGSHQKMMNEIFNSAKRPFFASCANMQLNRIEKNVYVKFIIAIFKKHKRQIETAAAAFVYDWCLGHTYYVQYTCNKIFASTAKLITIEVIKEEATEILKQQEASFYQFRNLMSNQQWKILVALSKVEQLKHPNSKDFVQKYGLSGASSVNRAIKALEEKEMIFYNASVNQPYYETYNKFLMRWIQGKY